jgi:hypothetical protein
MCIDGGPNAVVSDSRPNAILHPNGGRDKPWGGKGGHGMQKMRRVTPGISRDFRLQPPFVGMLWLIELLAKFGGCQPPAPSE